MVIRKLKTGKSTGENDIVNKVWKYGGEKNERKAMRDM